MWFTAAILLCGLTVANAIDCYSCTGDLNGCTTGKCTGDYCIDSVTQSDSGNVLGRGCYSVIAGAKNQEKLVDPSPCVGRNINGTSNLSICPCNSKNYCATGPLRENKRSGTTKCLCGKVASQGTLCNGDMCITEGDAGGVVNYDTSGKFDYHMPGFPKPNHAACEKDTNVKFSEGEYCQCNADFCNANPSSGNYKPERNTVKCFTDAGGYCYGTACVLRQVFVNKVTHKAWFSQGCQYNSDDDQFDRYCTQTEIGDTVHTECICSTDLCNEQIEVAEASVMGLTTPKPPTTTPGPSTPPPPCPEDKLPYNSCKLLVDTGYCAAVNDVKEHMCPRFCGFCGEKPTPGVPIEPSTAPALTTVDPLCNHDYCLLRPGKYNRVTCPKECPDVDCTKQSTAMTSERCTSLALAGWCTSNLGDYCPGLCKVTC